MTNRYLRVLVLLFVLFAAGLCDRLAASTPGTLLWDTGAPHEFVVSGAENYTGYTSGNLSTTAAQDWVASPFSITGGSATLTQINADWYNIYSYSGSGATVNYEIWRRNGLTAPQPGDLVSAGTLGSYSQAGINDPRIPVPNNGALFQYPINIPLSAGNYYLSIYAAGPGNATLSWLRGRRFAAGRLAMERLLAFVPLPCARLFFQYALSDYARVGHERSLGPLERIVLTLRHAAVHDVALVGHERQQHEQLDINSQLGR